MKTPLRVLGFFLAGATALGFAGSWYLGAFESVDVELEAAGPFFFAFRHAPLVSFEDIEAVTSELDGLCVAAGLEARRPAQRFHPDGSVDVGFFFDVESVESLASLGAREDVDVTTLARDTFMAASFPLKNPLSFLFAFRKLEPAFTEYREQRGFERTPSIVINEGRAIRYLQRVQPAE